MAPAVVACPPGAGDVHQATGLSCHDHVCAAKSVLPPLLRAGESEPAASAPTLSTWRRPSLSTRGRSNLSTRGGPNLSTRKHLGHAESTTWGGRGLNLGTPNNLSTPYRLEHARHDVLKSMRRAQVGDRLRRPELVHLPLSVRAAGGGPAVMQSVALVRAFLKAEGLDRPRPGGRRTHRDTPRRDHLTATGHIALSVLDEASLPRGLTVVTSRHRLLAPNAATTGWATGESCATRTTSSS